jgi:DNA-binding PadR family transcriptional regulator
VAMNREISELEGAILSEIEHRGQQTAFQVRRAFADSFSLEWKGSAGAVYPAVRRLTHNRMLRASAPKGGRATRYLSLTALGRQTLLRWACDASRAASVGLDPFRLRAGIWILLNGSQRKTLFKEINTEITKQIQAMSAYGADTDPVEKRRLELALAVQQARREQMASWLS